MKMNIYTFARNYVYLFWKFQFGALFSATSRNLFYKLTWHQHDLASNIGVEMYASLSTLTTLLFEYQSATDDS